MHPFRFVLLCAITSAALSSHAQGGKTYCNPLDLDYQYNFEQRERNISYRSGADPVLINHKGEYYLFGTIAGGYWHSKNLRDWRHVKPTEWPARDMVAPAALSAKGKLFLFPATYEQRPIYLVTGSPRANGRTKTSCSRAGCWSPIASRASLHRCVTHTRQRTSRTKTRGPFGWPLQTIPTNG